MSGGSEGAAKSTTAPAPNRARGEVVLEFGGASYTVRPEWDRLQRLEDSCGSAFDLMHRLSGGGTTSIREVVGALAVVTDESPDVIGGAIIEDGAGHLNLELLKFLTMMMVGQRRADQADAMERKSANGAGGDAGPPSTVPTAHSAH